jgi:hypothetical protein
MVVPETVKRALDPSASIHQVREALRSLDPEFEVYVTDSKVLATSDSSFEMDGLETSQGAALTMTTATTTTTRDVTMDVEQVEVVVKMETMTQTCASDVLETTTAMIQNQESGAQTSPVSVKSGGTVTAVNNGSEVKVVAEKRMVEMSDASAQTIHDVLVAEYEEFVVEEDIYVDESESVFEGEGFIDGDAVHHHHHHHYGDYEIQHQLEHTEIQEENVDDDQEEEQGEEEEDEEEEEEEAFSFPAAPDSDSEPKPKTKKPSLTSKHQSKIRPLSTSSSITTTTTTTTTPEPPLTSASSFSSSSQSQSTRSSQIYHRGVTDTETGVAWCSIRTSYISSHSHSHSNSPRSSYPSSNPYTSTPSHSNYSAPNSAVSIGGSSSYYRYSMPPLSAQSQNNNHLNHNHNHNHHNHGFGPYGFAGPMTPITPLTPSTPQTPLRGTGTGIMMMMNAGMPPSNVSHAGTWTGGQDGGGVENGGGLENNGGVDGEGSITPTQDGVKQQRGQKSAVMVLDASTQFEEQDDEGVVARCDACEKSRMVQFCHDLVKNVVSKALGELDEEEEDDDEEEIMVGWEMGYFEVGVQTDLVNEWTEKSTGEAAAATFKPSASSITTEMGTMTDHEEAANISAHTTGGTLPESKPQLQDAETLTTPFLFQTDMETQVSIGLSHSETMDLQKKYMEMEMRMKKMEAENRRLKGMLMQERKEKVEVVGVFDGMTRLVLRKMVEGVVVGSK